MKKRKREKNFIRNRSGGMKQKLPGRLLSLMCALVLVLSTVLLDLGHISAYAFGDELYLETEAEETAEAGAEAQAADLGDDESQINTELSEDISEDPAEVSAEEAEDASEADFSSGDNLDEQELTTEEPEISDDSAAETITYTQLINNDTIEVRAEAPAGALPEGTELVVKEIKNNTDDAEMTEQYNRLSARITEQLQNQGKNLDGFLPYNISFTDMDGNPVKPSEKVTYSFRYTEAAAPELTDPSASTVTAAQLKENKETAQLDLTELKAEENKLSLETNESRQLQKAAFQAADNAVYTFIWSSTPAADNNGETQEPESEPTQIGTIRLLVDEVNLRTAPSMEADVIGTADAGTELPLLEIITAEDGSTWYKVSYSDTVVYVSSEVAEVVEANGENQDEEPTGEAQLLTFKKLINNDTVEVLAEAPAGALPEGAELSVKPITNNTEDAEEAQQYAEVEGRLLQQAESNEQDLCGFLAYDISFVDVEGQKIEPSAEIKISMNYMETAVPESMTDTAEVNTENEDTPEAGNSAQTPTIEVLHFVEDQNGEVQNIVNMTQEGQASVKTTDDGQIQNAEFNTGSFSVFTITWTQKIQQANGVGETTEVNIKCVDTNGNEINVSELSDVRATKDTVIRLSDYEPYISGYGFVKAQIGETTYADHYAELKLIKAVQNNSAWTYSYLNDTSYTADTEWNTWSSGKPTVYLVYTPTELSIQDDLTGTGDLIPVLTDKMKTLVANAKEEGNEVSYIWEKSINNGDFQAVNKVKVSGDNYNITTNEDGVDCLNVALDKGALSSSQSSVKYKVSIKIGDELKGTSGEYSVRYYKELYNGDFEIPVVAQDHPNKNNWQYSNENYKAQGGVWQTTGTKDENPPYCDTDGADIEIVTTATKNLNGYNWYGTVCDADGNDGQFAELNCQAAGALYQDVITYSGEKLSFYLSHRARGGSTSSTKEYDTMYVVMMPTSSAKGCVTQGDLEKLIKKYLLNFNINQSYSEEGKEILYNKDGVCIERVTSDDQDWHYVEETQEYTATSNMTRFFFVAGKTATNNNTVGNFLDNVGFGQNLPPANPGTFTLKVEKKVVGLEPSAVLKHNMQFTIKAYNQDGSEATNAPLNGEHFSLNDMTYDEDGHVYSKLFANQNIGANKKYIYKVEETGSQVSTHTVATTQTVSGGEVQSDEESTKIGERDSVTFKITNTYTPINVDSVVEYNKTATLVDWDKRTYKIDLTASSKVTQTTTVAVPFDIVMVLDVSGSMDYTFYEYEKYTGDLVYGDYYYIKTSSGIYEKIEGYYTGYYGNRTLNWRYKDTYTGEYVPVTQGSTDIFTKKESNTTKLEALQNAATSFVDNVATKNPDNRISVVTFAGKSSIKSRKNDAKWLLRTGNSLDTIKSWINDLSANGATNSAAGLGSAVNVFNRNNKDEWEDVTQKTGRQKMVVFFTDGVPTTNNTFSTSVANNAKINAQTLKNQGATIYSLGIFDSASSEGYISSGTVEQIDEYMKGVASSDEKYMTADSVSSLNGLFDSITNSMPVAVTATVTDIIDKRFELTSDSRTTLEAGGATITDNTDGSTTITWANTEILGKRDSGETDIEKAGWHKEIYIKAKDAYIGGNDVPTNGTGSGVDVGSSHAEFPRPTVNVKVDFNIGNDETVIFKGNAIAEHFSNDVANGITKLVSTTGTDYTMLNDVNVSTKWYTDAACEHGITEKEIKEAKPIAETVYYAKVTVTPKTNGEASSANSIGDGKAKENYYRVDPAGVTKTGTYTVKIVSGAVQIEKQLETAATKDETFTFRVTSADVEGFESIEVPITIRAGETTGMLSEDDLAKLQSLPRGTYEVTESDVNGYALKNVSVMADKTNCYSSVTDDKVSFTLGSDSKQKDVIAEKTYETAGILGVAAFTNEKVTSDWGIKKVSASNNDITISGAVFKLAPSASDSSLSTYYGKSQENGTVKWYTDTNCNTEIEGTIPKGSYTLSEETAPTGYMRSTETWTIEIASKGALKSIKSGGQEIATEKVKTETVNGKEIVYYLYENEVVYSLPSSGGPGIYGFTISGVAFITAALLLFINNKRKEDKARFRSTH